MLTMDQINLIRYLKNHKGKSLRKIAKETDHDFKTVKKYFAQHIQHIQPQGDRINQMSCISHPVG